MRMGFSNRKRGFTLVETVVSVGIVAALAAVVYPAVVKQFDSADPTRVAEDLSNIKTGIETFGVNVRPNQPRDVEDLTNPVSTAGDLAIRGGNYSLSDSANWRGPYVTLAVPSTAAIDDTVVTTGFSAVIINKFSLFDTDGAAAATGGDTVSTANVANAEFLTVRLLGLTGAAFNAINLLIDGPNETTAAMRRQQGRFRCPLDTTPTDTEACAIAFYFAVSVR
jgi:prepilin-type N-terminal cleavage/methylation domain-containing protein